MCIMMLTSRCREYLPSSLFRRWRRPTLYSLVSLYPQASPSKSTTTALLPTAPSRSQPSLTIPRISSQPASTLPWLPSQLTFTLPWLLRQPPTFPKRPTFRHFSPPTSRQRLWRQAPRPGSEAGLGNTLTLVREVILLLYLMLILSHFLSLLVEVDSRKDRKNTCKSATSPVSALPAGARSLHAAPTRVSPRGLRPNLHQAEPPGGSPPQPRRGQTLPLLTARLCRLLRQVNSHVRAAKEIFTIFREQGKPHDYQRIIWPPVNDFVDKCSNFRLTYHAYVLIPN